MDIPKKMPCVDVNDAYAHVVNKFQCNILVMDISPTAYSKIFSHAVKYPTSTIGGYLIGTKSTTTVSSVLVSSHASHRSSILLLTPALCLTM